MSNSIGKIFTTTLKKYSYILQKDFIELGNMFTNKRKSFLKNGIKIFMSQVEKDMEVFNLEIDYFTDVKTGECFLDTVISIELATENFKEYIVYCPIKSHIFYTDGPNVFFNDKKITEIKNINNLKIRSINPLFLHNLYICYMLIGAFKEITISQEHLENNKFAFELINRLNNILTITEIEGNKVISNVKAL
jgi:hypothetical protein